MKNRVYLKKFFKSIIILTLSVLLFYSFGLISNKKNVLANVKNNKQNVEVFKTPSCGCCYGYVLFLEKEQFNVKETDMRSLHSIKQKYNIPLEMQSCHTTIIGKYFIEGHVPLEAINKLLKEKKYIDDVLKSGAQKAERISKPIIEDIYKIVGLLI